MIHSPRTLSQRAASTGLLNPRARQANGDDIPAEEHCPAATGEGQPGRFRPEPPQTIEQAGLNESLVESLVFKHLLATGRQTGREITTALGMPTRPIIDLLANLKAQQFVYYKDSTAIGDFEYALSDAGRERARSFVNECAYVGVAPVTLEDYACSVRAQNIEQQRPERADLQRAFQGLLIRDHMFERLGPAINSGRGLFLYGPPGNGKTSIAERITACFGGTVWVPHAIVVAGEIITFYDPESHQAVGKDRPKVLKNDSVDGRWVEIHRPTIIAGGELTMDSLDLQHNPHTRITEPPLQLKSNTGTLVIDDFGRQRMSVIELLNRWIVPLEKRYDFLSLSNGKKIRVPFEQLIVFSTNLEPRDLVDEAFLRRIPYKIDIGDPTEEEFRQLFRMMAPDVGVELNEATVDRLMEKHYRACGRPLRCCHPRDLLQQIKNLAAYRGQPARMTDQAFDAAVENYFAVM